MRREAPLTDVRHSALEVEAELDALLRDAFRDASGVLERSAEIRRGLDAFERRDRLRLEAFTHWVDGAAYIGRAEIREALESASLAERLASRVGEDRVLGGALGVLASCFHQLGHWTPALQQYDHAITVLAGIDPNATHALRVNRIALLRAMARLEEAAVGYDEVVATAASHSSDRRVSLLINAASCWRQVRRLEDARRVMEGARLELDKVQRAELVPWWHAIAAWLATDEADPSRAQAHATRALAASRPADLALRSSAARALATAAGLPGTPAALMATARTELEAVARDALERPMLGVAQDATEALADLYERAGDVVATVRYLRQVHELTERRRAEGERLRLQAEDLRLELLKQQIESDQLRARTEALAEANRALAEVDSARLRLLHSVAHDLRNPLTAILTVSELLDPAEPELVAELTRELKNATRRMVSMIEHTLTDETLATGLSPIARQTLDLRPWLERAVHAFGPLASRRRQELVLEASDLLATCDPLAFSRIVDNVVGNALKHAGEGGRIEVSASTSERELRLVVQDDGPGFASQDPTRALLLGEQLGAEAIGHGIGLHNVYDLASRLGGVVELENVAAGGARVRVRLPLR